MAAVRQHSATLIAGLVVLGAIAFAAVSVLSIYDAHHPGPLLLGLIWLAGAFAGAHLARRLVPELDLGSLCVAATVVILIALGIQHRLNRSAIDAWIAVQLALTFVGSLAGAWTAKNRKENVSRLVAVLGAGAASFGAGIIVLGVGVLISESAAVVALLIGAPLGGILVTRFARVETAQCAIGQAVLAGFIVALAITPDGLPFRLVMGAVGALLGWLPGVIGGAIGVALRPRRTAPDLPAARKVE